MSKNEEVKLEADKREAKHFREVVMTFQKYKTIMLRQLTQAEQSYAKVKEKYGLKRDFDLAKTLVLHNQTIIDEILSDVESQFGYKIETDKSIIKQHHAVQFDRIKTTLKQIMRDWSALGADERDAAYGPVLAALEASFEPDKRAGVKVLVPGCGLGRLVWECFSAGFDVEGNEFSLYMLMVSSFILNSCADCGPNQFQYRVFPFIHERDNVLDWADVEREVKFPDVIIHNTRNEGGAMNMAMGEFLHVYREPNQFDAILSVFFIDTAHNIADYIEQFHRIMKPGAKWINNGPLLYHFAEISGEESVELSWTEVKHIIERVGFTIEEERLERGLVYTQNPARLMHNTYSTVFFVARRN